MRGDAPAKTGRQYAIEGSLLADDTGGWRNLGDWSATEHYRDAAEALAVRIGVAAGLHEGMNVLDLACGYGASLNLWRRRFGVNHVAGLERQTACVEHLHAMASNTCTVAQGRFDQLPLPPSLSAHAPYDAVVCVDAAYHARSLRALAAVARCALRVGGRFAFTTLAINAEQGELPLGLSLALRGAGIPTASLLHFAKINTTLMDEGFAEISIEQMDQAVFTGFGNHVARREKALNWRQRNSFGWLKIKGTGMLCDALAKSGRLHYVVVRGQAS